MVEVDDELDDVVVVVDDVVVVSVDDDDDSSSVSSIVITEAPVVSVTTSIHVPSVAVMVVMISPSLATSFS